MAQVYESPTPHRRAIPWIPIIGIAVLLLVVLPIVLIILNWNAVYAWGDNALRFLFDYNSRVNPANVIECRGNSACTTIHAFVFSAIVFFIIITGFAYTTLLERVVIARFQHRVGPNRVGPWGLLQPAADGLKLIFKEDIEPAGAFKAVYLLAPILKTVPTFIVIAVIPFGPPITIPWFDGNWYRVPLGLADPNVGVLWLLAITSIGTYGVVLAGWASNNKYAMLGGLRATAQMLSYELSLGLTMSIPILLAASMNVLDIIQQQRFIWEWYIFQNPLAAAILFIALLAEVNRSPFDLPEAEQELTAGFMTEYSGMKFATFMMAEYLGMIGISMIFASLYLGGYQDGFGLVDALPILGPLVIIGKVILLLMFMIWIRATLPRIRYDRLMTFGWKTLLPLALVAVGWTAVSTLIGDSTGNPLVYAIVAGAFFTVVVIGGFMLLRDRGEVEEEAGEHPEDDPIITGERRGLGWMALQALGAVIAIPFALFDFTLRLLEGIANNLAPEEAPAESETKPVPTREATDTSAD
jgi:NADH-quinone oxidoreductase subunit H